MAAACRHVIESRPGLLTLYSDGSFERSNEGHVKATESFEDGVATRDVTVDGAAEGVWARIFLPKHSSQPSEDKLPVVLHFHGGGFCVGSPAARHTQAFCRTMAAASRSLWISVAYRLSPEHKLPAAYDDAIAAFRWLFNSHDSWIAAHADRSRVFIAGESAGGTIAHYLAVEIARSQEAEAALQRLSGVVVVHPAFPQTRPIDGANLSSALVRFYHQSSLPIGADFGHPLMNPLHPLSPAPASQFPRSAPLLVAVAELDPLVDGGILYFNAVAELPDAPPAYLFQTPGQGHCFHLRPENDPAAAAAASSVRNAILTFISQHRCS